MKKILALFSIILISFNTHAYRFAYTLSSKTIVYADQALKIPIGYIKPGRKLKVADKSLKRNTIVGLVVTGRVAYVKTKDLQFDLEGQELDENPKIKEHNVDILFKTAEDKLTENNYFVFDYSIIDGGAEWDQLNESLGSTDSSDIASYQFKVEHRSPQKNTGFSFALSWLTSSTESVKLKTLVGDAEYQFRLFQTELFSIEGYAGGSLSGDIQFKTGLDQISKGILIGYSFGGRVRLFPFSQYGLYGAAGFKKILPKSTDPLATDDGDITIKSLGGVQLSFGLSYKL